MPLRQVSFQLDTDPLPDWATRIIATGEQAIERFRIVERNDPVPAFHASNFEMAFRLLRTALAGIAPEAQTFCEWGSGIPIVAALADGLGLDASAIEIDERLCKASRQWLATLDNQVELHHASFISHHDHDLLTHYPPTGGVTVASADQHVQADIIYAYPWPGEDNLFEQLFERHASEGEVLITFHGSDHFCMRQAS